MRYLIPLALLLALVAGLVGTKYQQIAKLIAFGKEAERAGPPPEVVGTAMAREDRWEDGLAAVGTVAAARGVAVTTEAPGVVTKILFDSGETVRAGQPLVILDSSVERAQLASIMARRELAALSASRSRALVDRQAAPRSQLDSDEAQLKSSRADADALQAQIDRKTVRAPFAGRLGIRAVNLGQYLSPGVPVTTLQALGSVYVDFTLPQQALADVRVGGTVNVRVSGTVQVSESGGKGKPLAGVIAAIDPAVEASSRSFKLRATVPNPEERLRPGMFVEVRAVLPPRAALVTAPATAVVHAPYGDSVFVVEDVIKPATPRPDGKPVRKLRQQFVRTGPARGDFVALLDGVKPGQELVTVGAFKLRNGGTVIVNNDIQAAPSLTPQVENR